MTIKDLTGTPINIFSNSWLGTGGKSIRYFSESISSDTIETVCTQHILSTDKVETDRAKALSAKCHDEVYKLLSGDKPDNTE